MNDRIIKDEYVARAFAQYDDAPRAALITVRARIFEIASNDDEIGAINETLKWGQPAYLTYPQTGTTIRLDAPKSGGIAIYTHCATRVMSDFSAQFPELTFEGNRAVHFESLDELPIDRIDWLIHRALRYHLKT